MTLYRIDWERTQHATVYVEAESEEAVDRLIKDGAIDLLSDSDWLDKWDADSDVSEARTSRGQSVWIGDGGGHWGDPVVAS